MHGNYIFTRFQEQSAPVKALFKPNTSKYTKWDTIVNAVKSCKYTKAIEGLYGATNGSRQHFLGVCSQIVKKEIKSFPPRNRLISVSRC